MTFDVRNLTDEQRSLADDIASAMGYGHADECAVWWEEPDGCSCPLLEDVANALHGVRIVEVTQELGYDSTTYRGDRLVRRIFDPHPLGSEPTETGETDRYPTHFGQQVAAHSGLPADLEARANEIADPSE